MCKESGDMNAPQNAASLAAPWRVRLFGTFALHDPLGCLVRLPDRKIEGLVAVLVVHRRYGIERSSAAEILWPGRTPDNLPNLRRALSVLRSTLGEEAIESTRLHCRLSTGSSLNADY